MTYTVLINYRQTNGTAYLATMQIEINQGIEKAHKLAVDRMRALGKDPNDILGLCANQLVDPQKLFKIEHPAIGYVSSDGLPTL